MRNTFSKKWRPLITPFNKITVLNNIWSNTETDHEEHRAIDMDVLLNNTILCRICRYGNRLCSISSVSLEQVFCLIDLLGFYSSGKRTNTWLKLCTENLEIIYQPQPMPFSLQPLPCFTSYLGVAYGSFSVDWVHGGFPLCRYRPTPAWRPDALQEVCPSYDRLTHVSFWSLLRVRTATGQ